MNTTEGLAPLCRVLRISPCKVAIGLRFTENVKVGGVILVGCSHSGGGAVQPSLVKERLQSIARDNRVARGIIRKKMRKCMLDSF